ncbi:MAG: SDR family oxidoreductase [Hydrogenibacillus sp.]|nr:SDR family oxidoreductase [Hydrogenibacillus sp.]
MDLLLRGKVAVISGASQGLGRATAHLLAQEGARVALLSRSREKLEDARRDILAQTGQEDDAVQIHPLDVRDKAAVEQAIQTIRAHFGGIDILLANAGGPPAGTFETITDEQYEDAFQTLFMGTVRLIRAVLPSMRTRGGGRIGIITSQSVKAPMPGLLLSNAIRAGVTGLARTLANEVAKDGILINCFAPGRVDTERTRTLDAGIAEREGLSVEAVKARMSGEIPLGRYGTPEEFARVAAFYLSFANTYVTGQTILIDGGKVGTLW